MRPTRLELQGFASFRDHTVVDFAGADLFVLSGPTGAGKSSIIDAMTFALYGSVARYGSKLVEPVISQGRKDARVLLEFTVEGVGYRAARRVQRTKDGGATTKEARLERLPEQEGGDPLDLAIGAREVTAEVESLLGLTFDHFCRTVVLPQGAFQDFLHATPSERQELLVQLLDLGIYRHVASRARSRGEEAAAQVRALAPRLEALAGVTDDGIAAERQRVENLDQLVEVVHAAQPELDTIRERGAERRVAQTQAHEVLARLAGIAAPDGLDDLAERLSTADRAVAEAGSTLDGAIAARESLEDALEGAPAAKDLAALLEERAGLPALVAADEAARRAQEIAETACVDARKVADEAGAAVTDAQAALRAAEASHGVHALRDHLVAGEPCPLCTQPVATMPERSAPAHLERTRAQLDEVRSHAASTAKAASDAEVTAARAAEQVTAATRRVAERTEELVRRAEALGLHAQTPDVDIRKLADDAATSEARLAELRLAERGARKEQGDRQEARRRLDGARQQALATLHEAHARVADLGAPAATEDLAASWAALVAWSQEARPAREQDAAAADAAVAEAVAAWKARNQLVLEACTRASVAVPEGSAAAAAAATARAEAAGRLERLLAQQAEAVHLAAEVERLRAEGEVARTLGQLLNAKNFEQWLLARGLTRLVLGASAILGDLTRGNYALALGVDNAFLVVDHGNAGEERHARSLSGGETFLASLALALSLAEHVADLAAKGSARLESLFLDEGFGTLDADTLDTVAASIEELGATGRMVGVITHVRDLAERVPVRFEISKGPDGSRLTRVDS